MQPSLFPWGEIKNKKPFFWRVFCWSFQTGWVSLGDRNSWQGKSPLVPHLSGKPADRDFPWCSLFLLYWPGYSSVFREVLSYTGKRKTHLSSGWTERRKTSRHRGFQRITGISDVLKLLKILCLELESRQFSWCLFPLILLKAFPFLIFFLMMLKKIIQKTTAEKAYFPYLSWYFLLWSSLPCSPAWSLKSRLFFPSIHSNEWSHWWKKKEKKEEFDNWAQIEGPPH